MTPVDKANDEFTFDPVAEAKKAKLAGFDPLDPEWLPEVDEDA